MIDTYMDAVSRIPGMDSRRLHEALRAAKLLRRRIECGDRPPDAEWFDIFRSPSLLQLARIHLDEGQGPTSFDPEATDTHARERHERWSSLMKDIPDEGLAREGSAERIGSFDLRRQCHAVSNGWSAVDYEALPTERGFRERFVGAARATGRLDLIRGMPLSA